MRFPPGFFGEGVSSDPYEVPAPLFLIFPPLFVLFSGYAALAASQGLYG